MKSVKIALMGLCLSTVQVMAASTVNLDAPINWMQSLKPNPGVQTEIQKFGNLSSVYAAQLPMTIKEKISQQVKNALGHFLRADSCEESITVNFLNSVTDQGDRDARIRDFESQFIRIELVSCMPQVTPAAAVKVWLSPDYQRKAFPEIKESIHTGDKVCQKAAAFGVGKSENCYHNSVLESEGNYFVHSFVDYNGTDVDAVTFFREFSVSLVQYSKGTIFHGLMYVRGKDISGFLKGIAQSKIVTSNQNALNDLKTRSLREQAGVR